MGVRSASHYGWVVTGILALALVLGGWFWWTPGVPRLVSGALLEKPRPLRDFSLRAESGAPFTLEELRGHWTVIFAGYTHCPDVCPLTLAQLKQAKARLGTASEGLRVLFLSVDPERDTSEGLANYVRHFDPDFRAATGTRPQLETLAYQLGIVFLKAPNSQGEGYTIDHSAELVLIDPQGRLAGYLLPPFSPEGLAADLATVLGRRAR
ncbi:SCO family protein [Candidatus Methylocalor cossyra]|uniref:Cytochrome oxidase biogenesis protein Sco1/SenC/PrrC, copper metallochaperone n=1 Tax=Candidatus Methylocalor cossyra TaxID=3108543 RepID=A0ABM9NEH6_9GAMM